MTTLNYIGVSFILITIAVVIGFVLWNLVNIGYTISLSLMNSGKWRRWLDNLQ